MRKCAVALILFCSGLLALPDEAWPSGISFGGMRLNVKVKNYREIRDRNIVKQGIDFSCGPASLATLMTYYLNDEVTEGDIIEYLLDNLSDERWAAIEQRQGFSLMDLKAFAVHRGYRADGYEMDISGLVGLGKPVIIQIRVKNYDHFVVFREAVGNRAFLADPAMGNRVMPLSQLKNIWKGVGLIVEDPSQFVQGKRPDYPLRVGSDESALPQDIVAGRALVMDALRNYVSHSEF